MDEIFFQIRWRCSKREDKFKELGTPKEQILRFLCSFFANLDVISDFTYWNSIKGIKKNFDGKKQATDAVLAFAIIGLLLEFRNILSTIEYYNERDEKEKEKTKTFKQIGIPYITMFVEDFPQLTLLLYISNKTRFSNAAVFSFWSGFFSFVSKTYSIAIAIGKNDGEHTNRESALKHFWSLSSRHEDDDKNENEDDEMMLASRSLINCSVVVIPTLIILFFVFYFSNN